MGFVIVSGSAARITDSLTTLTNLTVDVGTGTDRLLLLGLLHRGSDVTPAVTYNSITMSQAVAIANGAIKAYIYYLFNPTSGSNTLSVSYGSNQIQNELQAVAFTGSDQVSPLDATNPATGNSNTPSVSVTPTTNNQLVFGAIIHASATALSTGTGETAVFNNDNGNWVTSTSYAIQATAATQVVNWTAGSANDWAAVAATFKEAAGGGGGINIPVVMHHLKQQGIS